MKHFLSHYLPNKNVYMDKLLYFNVTKIFEISAGGNGNDYVDK